MTIPMYEGLCALSHKESDMQFEDYRLLRLRETDSSADRQILHEMRNASETDGEILS